MELLDDGVGHQSAAEEDPRGDPEREGEDCDRLPGHRASNQTAARRRVPQKRGESQSLLPTSQLHQTF